MTVSPQQLAGLLNPPAPTSTGRCSRCQPKFVCPDHKAQYPSGPPQCRANCGEPLDPVLWGDGLHIGCTEPTPTPLFAAPAGPTKHPLKDELIGIVRWAAANDPRTLQVALGPSDLGVDCMRRLAYGLSATAAVNDTADPWFAIVGKAVHEWLGTTIELFNANSGRPFEQRRYWVEERLRITSDQFGLSGSCDLYDADRATVIDHKVVGATALKKYIDKGPSNVYRTQVHLYGLGHIQAGRPVREVAIAFYPRSGYLSDMHVWSEPFDAQIALDALRRAATVQQLATVLPPDQIPASPDPAGCTWCDFYRPGGPADATGCPAWPNQGGKK